MTLGIVKISLTTFIIMTFRITILSIAKISIVTLKMAKKNCAV